LYFGSGGIRQGGPSDCNFCTISGLSYVVEVIIERSSRTVTTLLTLEERVELALVRVRPYLLVDGGNVELVRIDHTAMVVEVCLMGACRTCSLAPMTLRAGIERAILHDVPEIRRVESVSKPISLEYRP
jgi:Fe-S cluster biogenesis protein NfuA